MRTPNLSQAVMIETRYRLSFSSSAITILPDSEEVEKEGLALRSHQLTQLCSPRSRTMSITCNGPAGIAWLHT